MAEYRQALQDADQVLADEGVELGADTWQEMALEWFTSDERELENLAGYMAAHEGRLGPRWARELLRLGLFAHEEYHEASLTHYQRVMARYPRCAVVELWVATVMAYHSTDWWRTRSMLLYTVEQFPDHARPRYELGFQHHLLGDFAGAVAWFDEAAARLVEDEVDLGAQVYLNRAIAHISNGGDRKTAIAGIKEALRLKPDYVKAQEALHKLGGKVRWTPWLTTPW
jgi:tetratricopeptide (TPR) repeat protein